MTDRYLSPMPVSAPTRVADRLLDEYLAQPIGTPLAFATLAETIKAHRGGKWERNQTTETPKKERRPGKPVGDLTQAERRRIVSMYLREYTLTQIAQSVGGSVGTVNRFLDAERIPRRRKHLNRMKIEAQIRIGKTAEEIADCEECSVSAVKRIQRTMK